MKRGIMKSGILVSLTGLAALASSLCQAADPP